MPDSYFRRLAETPTDGRYLAGPATAGPWSPTLQHGGPPNALAVAAAERAVRAQTGREDLLALRFAADFVGPVPLGEVSVTTRVLRAARSAALAEVVVAAQDRDCLRVRVWFVRAADTAAVASPARATVPARPAGPGALGMQFGYADSIDWRFTEGAFTVPGPAGVWARPQLALVDGDDADPAEGGFGTDVSGLARVALIADSASGISAELDWSAWSFANVDLDVHLSRPLRGPWLHMQAQTVLGPTGSALASSTLFDGDGALGAGLQTLVVAPIPKS